MLSFFPRGVLDEILNLIESVSEGFPSYFDYPKLWQLLFVEEFKRCINSDVKSFLDEKAVETLEKAARLADDYTLTHNVSFVNKANPRKPFYPIFGHKPSPSL